ncbi:hypothetical protein AGDE_14870 [Angomonas deanei]|uniref:Elapor1/2 TNF receptor-like domain-containing protein n=1 Tax=Angomonas deanei TaxID=59799 RepID=A0A7G2CJB3_9TRYP|nr:hypothetical protein AGDE_14870 [Angomonas deanei]CAD2218352.1 hypothetical protein, conserved [Angomonas deanei]|eukprot:EPY20076.1 hypothetical protein AGDE_14870 [Angomonas deanei]
MVSHVFLVFLVICSLPSVYCRSCEEGDLVYKLSECDSFGERVQYATIPTNAGCDASEMHIPPSKVYKCDHIECNNGKYINAKTMTCEECKGGYYSPRFQTFKTFPVLPKEFSSYCFLEPCSPWVPSEGADYLHSGNQSLGSRGQTWWGGSSESVQSILSMPLEITEKEGGALLFEYRIESERNFDGLLIALNGTTITNTDADEVGSGSFFATGIFNEWRGANITLPYGKTVVLFIYYKDYNQAGEGGADRAFIRNIQIAGHSYSAGTECLMCPAGYYAGEGASHCTICPEGTFSEQGSAKCTPCPEGDWAPEGSRSCNSKGYCTLRDYVAIYTPCTANQTRTRRWKLVKSGCEPNDPSFDNVETVECAPCNPGMYRDENMKCISCGEGQYLNGKECAACEKGMAAIPSLHFKNGFDAIDDLNSLRVVQEQAVCRGELWECNRTEGGFELGVFTHADEDNSITYIRSIIHANADSSISNLTFYFDSRVNGYVKFKYGLLPESGNSAGTNISQARQLSCVLDGVHYPVDSKSLGIHEHFVHLNYSNRADPTGKALAEHSLRLCLFQEKGDTPVSLVITELEIFGDVQGGAEYCSLCPAGHSCSGKDPYFASCKEGEYQPNKSAASCLTCPENAISSFAAERCTPCVSGRASPSTCNCAVTVDSLSYNFNEATVVGRAFGLGVPFYRLDLDDEMGDLSNDERFYFSLCKPIEDLCPAGSAIACSRRNQNTGENYGQAYVNYTHVPYNGTEVLSMSSVDGSFSLLLECDVSVDADNGRVIEVYDVTRDRLTFKWQTPLGCPRCTSGSFTRYEDTTECPTRKRVFYRPTRGIQCIGDYTPPADFYERCGNSRILLKLLALVVVVCVCLGVYVYWLKKSKENLEHEYRQVAQNVSELRNYSPEDGIDVLDGVEDTGNQNSSFLDQVSSSFRSLFQGAFRRRPAPRYDYVREGVDYFDTEPPTHPPTTTTLPSTGAESENDAPVLVPNSALRRDGKKTKSSQNRRVMFSLDEDDMFDIPPPNPVQDNPPE